MVAPFSTSSVVNLFKPENTCQYNLIKDPNSIRMKHFSINKGIPVTLYSNMFTFGDIKKSFTLDGDLLKTINLYGYGFKVSHSNPQDQKLIFEFGKEMNFISKQ